MDEAKNSFSEAKKNLNDAQKAVDECLHVAARGILKGFAVAQAQAHGTYKCAIRHLDSAQVYVDTAATYAKAVEDAGVSGVKGVLNWVGSSPYTAYPTLGTAFLFTLPGFRRLLWRQTFGRLSNPERVVGNSQAKVESLKGQVSEYASQVEKLEQRMQLAEAELKGAYSKLKSTRQELQRLGSQVTKSEKVATGVVQELRALKKMDSSLAVRGEAAQHAASLKAQRERITKGIYRIAKLDI